MIDQSHVDEVERGFQSLRDQLISLGRFDLAAGMVMRIMCLRSFCARCWREPSAAADFLRKGRITIISGPRRAGTIKWNEWLFRGCAYDCTYHS